MFARKTIWGVTAAVIVGLLLAGQSLSQPRQRGGNQGPGAGGPQGMQGPGGRQFDPTRMREMMEQRMREQLGATEQEWKVLGPRVMKVSELNRQVSGFGRGFGGPGFGGRRGGPMGGPQGGPQGGRQGNRAGAPQRELTEVEKASEQLQTTLENTAATSEQIKAQLTTLRAAKEKTKQELAVAQQELRKVVTVRQEAQLVLMGLLD